MSPLLLILLYKSFFPISIYGENLQETFTGKIYGEDLRGKFTGKIYGENLQGQFTGKIYEKNLRGKNMGKFTEKFKRKIYGKTKVKSTSLLIPLKNNNFCLR